MKRIGHPGAACGCRCGECSGQRDIAVIVTCCGERFGKARVGSAPDFGAAAPLQVWCERTTGAGAPARVRAFPGADDVDAVFRVSADATYAITVRAWILCHDDRAATVTIEPEDLDCGTTVVTIDSPMGADGGVVIVQSAIGTGGGVPNAIVHEEYSGHFGFTDREHISGTGSTRRAAGWAGVARFIWDAPPCRFRFWAEPPDIPAGFLPSYAAGPTSGDPYGNPYAGPGSVINPYCAPVGTTPEPWIKPDTPAGLNPYVCGGERAAIAYNDAPELGPLTHPALIERLTLPIDCENYAASACWWPLPRMLFFSDGNGSCELNLAGSADASPPCFAAGGSVNPPQPATPLNLPAVEFGSWYYGGYSFAVGEGEATTFEGRGACDPAPEGATVNAQIFARMHNGDHSDPDLAYWQVFKLYGVCQGSGGGDQIQFRMWPVPPLYGPPYPGGVAAIEGDSSPIVCGDYAPTNVSGFWQDPPRSPFSVLPRPIADAMGVPWTITQ